MSRWSEKISSHPIYENITKLRELANFKVEESSAEIETERRRFLKVLDQIDTILEQTDFEIAPVNLIDNIGGALRHQNVQGALAAFSEGGGLAQLVTANDHIDSQLTNIATLTSFAKSPDQNKLLRSLEKVVDAFIERVQNSQSALVVKQEELDKEANSQKSNFEAALEAIASEQSKFADELTNWKNEFTQGQTQREKAFTEAENQRSKQHTAKLQELETTANSEIASLLAESTDDINGRITTFSQSIAAMIDDAKLKHSDILALHELVAGDSVAAGYLNTANSETKSANFWRWASISFIALTAIWAAISYWSSPISIDWNPNSLVHSFKAFSVAGVLLFGAVYSGRQSALHRNNEHRARWLAIELKAFDPFVASLSDAAREELKAKLTDKLFGNPVEVAPKESSDDINIGALGQIGKMFSDILKAGNRS